MNKKIILLAAALMMFMGVVSASSINGDYKGNPIVKVIVNGNYVNSDVPAINYDGSTLVPLRAVVESIGASVNWDSNLMQATISTSQTTTSKNDVSSIINEVEKEAAKYNANNFRISYDKSGSYTYIDMIGSGDVSKDIHSIVSLFILSAYYQADDYYVKYSTNNQLMNTFSLRRSDINLYINKQINESELEGRVQVLNGNTALPPTSVPISTPQISQDTKDQLNQAKFPAINDVYDKMINNFKVSLGSRGIGNSSILDSNIKKFNEQRNAELQKNGCSIK